MYLIPTMYHSHTETRNSSHLLYNTFLVTAIKQRFSCVQFSQGTAQGPHIHLKAERHTEHHLKITIDIFHWLFDLIKVWE